MIHRSPILSHILKQPDKRTPYVHGNIEVYADILRTSGSSTSTSVLKLHLDWDLITGIDPKKSVMGYYKHISAIFFSICNLLYPSKQSPIKQHFQYCKSAEGNFVSQWKQFITCICILTIQSTHLILEGITKSTTSTFRFISKLMLQVRNSG